MNSTINAFHTTDVSRNTLLGGVESGCKLCDHFARILLAVAFDVSSYGTPDEFVIHSVHRPFYCRYILHVFLFYAQAQSGCQALGGL